MTKYTALPLQYARQTRSFAASVLVHNTLSQASAVHLLQSHCAPWTGLLSGIVLLKQNTGEKNTLQI